MDARIQKHRMARWLRRLFVVLTLVASWGAQAIDTIPPTGAYNLYWGFYYIPGQSYDNLLDKQNYSFYSSKCSLQYVPSSPVNTGYSAWFCGPIFGANGDVINFLWEIVANGITCPTATPAYRFNSITGMCERPEQESYTITLSGGTEVEPSNSESDPPVVNTLPISATVKDQNGQAPNPSVTVHVSLKVDPTSGGHAHGDSTRPRGGIASVQTCPSDNECWNNTTDVNGQVVFNFNPTDASGTHTISATCDGNGRGCTNTATKPVDVKVNGLKPIPAFSFYALNEMNGDVIGARPGWHTDNHNLTPTAAKELMTIASLYRTRPQFRVVVDKKTGKKDFPPALHINDASLPWGGVYDICARPGACPKRGIIVWKEPHVEHRRGTVVDVRANGDVGSIPASNKIAFIRLLKNKHIPYLHEDYDPPTSNEHFHLRLLGNAE